MESLESILERAVSPTSVRAVPRYLTSPPSYGVYRVPSSASSTRSVRFGNHPVRQRELEREFGTCKLEHLFLDRSDAANVAMALSKGR